MRTGLDVTTAPARKGSVFVSCAQLGTSTSFFSSTDGPFEAHGAAASPRLLRLGLSAFWKNWRALRGRALDVVSLRSRVDQSASAIQQFGRGITRWPRDNMPPGGSSHVASALIGESNEKYSLLILE
jgi:hypothetical protein